MLLFYASRIGLPLTPEETEKCAKKRVSASFLFLPRRVKMRLGHAQQECRDWLLAQPPGGFAVVAYAQGQPGPLGTVGFSTMLAALLVEQPVARSAVFSPGKCERLRWFERIANLVPKEQVITAWCPEKIEFKRGADVHRIAFFVSQGDEAVTNIRDCGPFDRVVVDGDGLARVADVAGHFSRACQTIVGVRLGHVDPTVRTELMAGLARALRQANKAADNDFALFEWGVGERPVRTRVPATSAEEGEN